MADSGAAVNFLSKKDFDGLKEKHQLLKTNVKVYPYMSSKPLNLCGKLRVSVASDHLSSEKTFYVGEGSSGSILSWITSQKLNLIKAVSTVEQPLANLPPGVPDCLKDFPCLLNGMGEYKGEPVRIHVDESVRPVAQPHRRIPFHVRKQVEDKTRQQDNWKMRTSLNALRARHLGSHQLQLYPNRQSRMKSEFVLTCGPSTKLSSESVTSFPPLTMWCQTSMGAKSLVRLILIKGTTRSRSTLIRDNSRHSLLMLGCFATSS